MESSPDRLRKPALSVSSTRGGGRFVTVPVEALYVLAEYRNGQCAQHSERKGGNSQVPTMFSEPAETGLAVYDTALDLARGVP